jgi:peptidoglycan hydrolase-like protein with peptidoglycan-binding domain
LQFPPMSKAIVGGLFAAAITLAAGSGAMAASPSSLPETLTTLEAAHPALRVTLEWGDQSHWVATLQADLNLLGFPAGPVDGIFGPKTYRGVVAFQRAHHLNVTGIVNEPTWQDILAGFDLVPPYAGTATAGDNPPGATGNTSGAGSSTGSTSNGGTNGATATGSQKTIDGRPVIAVYHMIATAYGPSLQDNYPYGPVDAFGQPLAPGMVAVDPSVIPLKSWVYVTGYTDPNLPQGGFLGHAMDTGGAIKGNRIDIFMNADPTTVSNFGIEPVTVYLLGN